MQEDGFYFCEWKNVGSGMKTLSFIFVFILLILACYVAFINCFVYFFDGTGGGEAVVSLACFFGLSQWIVGMFKE